MASKVEFEQGSACVRVHFLRFPERGYGHRFLRVRALVLTIAKVVRAYEGV